HSFRFSIASGLSCPLRPMVVSRSVAVAVCMQHSGTPLAPEQGMPDDKDEVRGFDKEVEEEDAADLPQREAMSLLLDPTALVGGGLVPSLRMTVFMAVRRLTAAELPMKKVTRRAL